MKEKGLFMSKVKVNIEAAAEVGSKQTTAQLSKPLTNAAGDVRELTSADLAQFKPIDAVLPADWMAKHVRRGKQKAPTKVATTIRFDADVLQAVKSTGRGWQTRVNDAVREWAKAQHPTV